MLLNYHIGRLVLSSLCVGILLRLVFGGVRFAGFNKEQNLCLPSKPRDCNSSVTDNGVKQCFSTAGPRPGIGP